MQFIIITSGLGTIGVAFLYFDALNLQAILLVSNSFQFIAFKVCFKKSHNLIYLVLKCF